MADTISLKIKDNLLQKANQNRFPKSPLRYPGGKARAVEIILGLIPYNITQFMSPFMGGGSIEIAVASLGVHVQAFDIFDPLVDFWKELLTDAPRLASKVKEYFPLSKDKFYELQKSTFPSGLENGAIFYVLNRSSFSGSTLSGGMSPGHPRFTKSSISYLENFSAPNLKVDKGDFHETIPQFSDTFLYLDPPYLIYCTLYGKNGNTHKDFEHEDLCGLLKKRDKWILSYNDCPEIRDMYKDFRMFTPQWKYGMSNNKDSRELLIISNDLPDTEESQVFFQSSLF